MTADPKVDRAIATVAERFRDELAKELRVATTEALQREQTERENAVRDAENRVLADVEKRIAAVQAERDAAVREIQSRARAEAATAKAEREAAIRDVENKARIEAEQRAIVVKAERASAIRDLESRIRAEAEQRAATARSERDIAVRDAENRGRAEGERQAAVAQEAVEARARDQVRDAVAAADARARDQLRDAVAAADARAADQLRNAVSEAEARTRAAADREAVEERTRARQAFEAAAGGLTSHLNSAIRAMDAADSLTAIIDALVVAISYQAARVAVMLPHGNELRGWRFAGFGKDCEPAESTFVALEESGILAEAVRSGRPVTTQVPAQTAVPWFAPTTSTTDQFAAAIALNDELVAVVYADHTAGGLEPIQSTWSAALELLVRYAARCLEAATATNAFRLMSETRSKVRLGPRKVRSKADAPSGAADHTSNPAAAPEGRLDVDSKRNTVRATLGQTT